MSYADDAALAFAQEDDARRVRAVLAKRLAKYGLTLHPDKTGLVDFRRPEQTSWCRTGHSFDLLGFTHYWGLSRKGWAVIVRKTAKDRMGAALQRIAQWCKAYCHWLLAQQHRVLNRQLAGHYIYYEITGNASAINRFRQQAERRWRFWLSRRSRKAAIPWHRYKRLLASYPLPAARVGPQHLPSRSERLDRGAGCGGTHVGICRSPGPLLAQGHLTTKI